MKLTQRHHVVDCDVCQQLRTDDAGIVDDMSDPMTANNILCRLLGCHRIEQVDFHMFAARISGFPPRQRNDVIARVQHVGANGGANAGAAAGDDGDSHGCVSISASTRSGLPDPWRIFSGAVSSRVPVGGN